MNFAWEASQAAYKQGDGRQAKIWSDERKRCKGEVDRLNAEASEFIFKRSSLPPGAVRNSDIVVYAGNNDPLPLNRIDLHGLYVRDAQRYAERAILQARQRGDPKVYLIVGVA